MGLSNDTNSATRHPKPLTTSEWDRRFLSLAEHISGWSKDPRAKIGAVITDSKNRVVAVGFNGFPAGISDDRRLAGEIKNDLTVHAEANALQNAGPRARGGTIYVSGKPTCVDCAGAIVQAGISRVVAPPPLGGTASKWDRSGLAAVKIFEQARLAFDADIEVHR